MGNIKVRYLEEKKLAGGKVAYYWNCRHARKLGLDPSVALGSDLAVALARAADLNKLYDEVRNPPEMLSGHREGTLGWMLDKVEKSEAFNELPLKTQKEIGQSYRWLRMTPLIKAPIEEISGDDVTKMHKGLSKEASLDVAARCCKWLRWSFNKAKSGKLMKGENPMNGLRVKKPAPRQIYWFEEEVEQLVAKADEMGLPSIGTAVRIAFDVGQREGDCLRFPWAQYDRGDVIVRQNKVSTDEKPVVVRIPALPELVSRFAATPKVSPIVIISEVTGRPYKQVNFIHKVATVITAAGFKGKKFSDLRRSAVVRLAQSNCTIPEIASITGHSLQRVEQILQTYLPRTTPMARAAIQKVIDARKA